MSSFYKNWVMGMTKREAFNLAQKEVRTEFKEPYYWGAFVMVGE
jgi:CHAT domain-containing protein